MSSKSKKKKYKFSFSTIIRLIIFSLVLYFSISFLAQKQEQTILINDPTVLNEEVATNSSKSNINLNSIYQKLPGKTRQKIESIDYHPLISFFQVKIDQIKPMLNGFPQKQIKDLKKMVLKNTYDDLIKNIDQQ